MAKSVGVVWQVSPEKLAKAFEQYGVGLQDGLMLIAERNAQDMQNTARRNAPWADRTGNARSGLFATPDREGQRVVIYLAHSVSYGVYLELALGGRYEIIWPTILLALNRIERDLKGLLNGQEIRAGKAYRR